jgi:hypothetical protein
VPSRHRRFASKTSSSLERKSPPARELNVATRDELLRRVPGPGTGIELTLKS